MLHSSGVYFDDKPPESKHLHNYFRILNYMDKIWLYITAVIVFALLAAISYKLMKTYVKKTFGENWLKSWVNRAYFGQCLIFISGGGTLLVLFLLK